MCSPYLGQDIASFDAVDGGCFQLWAYSVKLYHQSGAGAVSIVDIIVVDIAISVQVIGVVGVVRIRGKRY